MELHLLLRLGGGEMAEFKETSPGLKQMLDKAEEMEWSYTLYIEESQDNRTYAEMERYSPAGEDFLMVIDFDKDNQADSFRRDLRSYYEGFDVDEHVEMWIPSRGKGGCPSSVRDLVEDAEAIESMICDLLEVLEEMEVDDDES